MPSRLPHTLHLYGLALGLLLTAWVVLGLGRWLWLRLPRAWQKPTQAAAGYAFLSLFAVVFVAPFLWMLSTSLKVDTQIFSPDIRWLPTVPTVKESLVDSNGLVKESYVPVKTLLEASHTVRVAVLEELENGKSRVRRLDGLGAGGSADQVVDSARLKDIQTIAPQWHNYPDALNSFPFVTYTINTLIICVVTMIGTVLSAALPAYGFSRLRWKGRDALFFLLVATIMLPPQVTMLPVFLIFRWLGWTGTMLPLTVPAFFGSAFYIFLLRQFFLTIPQELSDAARIDGCSELGILWRILAPIARPALATVALLSFTAAWMDFTGPLIYLHDERTYTLAVGLLAFLGRHSGEWSLLMAAATVMTLPMLILFFFAQRTYIQGIALTGLKG
ncbi:MAG TPA: carbohydrate ABC transporter permease [Chthonomonadaceae bacterium]|nr:carbohydrate ABC transporter permease [Chthonomonadaceae bacterium]